MKAKRKRHGPEFKARVAIEALKGITTIQQIAKDYEVHPVQVSEWKKMCREIGHVTIWCRPRTTIPDDGARKYPYLLRGLSIDRPDHVWCTDIAYVPMPHGSAYLCALMDWHSRKVLGWELSNTMDTGLCMRALGNLTPDDVYARPERSSREVAAA